ncbi:hypothetical protein [Stomatohabitans albus]|uniref:RsiG family protein n=1 Tax=Stomatohabitans albus TaxID=3110766 RepID=UPI00300C70A4
MNSPARRRIDRVTAEDFLADMDSKSAAELRTMRDDCREEEDRLSYARRVLLGQLDVLQHELNVRGSDVADQAARVEAISNLFSDGDQAINAATMPTAHRHMYTAQEPIGRRRGDLVIEDVPLGNIPDMSVDDVSALVDQVTGEVQWVSTTRRKVLDHLDALQQELVRRYREGTTTIEDIVTP